MLFIPEKKTQSNCNKIIDDYEITVSSSGSDTPMVLYDLKIRLFQSG